MIEERIKERPKSKGRLPTEGFSEWLSGIRLAQKTGVGASVPCGECRGCCTSAYFIHVGPEEKETLARIPRKLAFAAPGLPKGHVLMGYDEKGHCPMFIDNKCSIYAHRPKTCRQYDCRIFPATGLAVGGEKPVIAGQSGRWEFSFPAAQDSEELRAVRAAAAFLNAYADLFPAGFVPNNPTQQAMVAIKVYPVFLEAIAAPEKSEAGKADAAARRRRTAAAMLAAYKQFERDRDG